MKLESFEVANLSFKPVKLPNQTALILLPKLNGNEVPNIRLPRIELTCYGVPRLGQYFKTDKDRQFLQLPIQGEILARFEMLDSIVRHNSTLTDTWSDSEYVPVVKHGLYGPYIKLKLETDYRTGDIETVVWRSVKQADNTIHTEHVDVNSMDEFAAMCPLNCSINCVIRLVKVWSINKRFGLTLKLVKANILQPNKPVDDCSGIEFDS